MSIRFQVCLSLLLTVCVYSFKSNGQSKYIVNNKTFKVKEVSRKVNHVMKEVGVPGASIAVINDGKIVFYKGYGHLDLHAKRPKKVNRRTKFQAASLSKTFVVFAAYQLISQGLINLDTPLYKYLEYDLLQYDERYKLITPRMVLSHSSGIENHMEKNNPEKLEIVESPGMTFTYSGEGYYYLAKVIEKILNKPIEQVLQESVYEPLKLKRTYTTSTGKANINHAASHDQFGRFTERRKNLVPSIGGHIHTTAKDYARVLIAMFDEKHVPKPMISQILTPQVQLDSDEPTTYGPGFELLHTSSDTLAFQFGDAEGFQGLGIYSTTNNSGFVYFANADRAEKIERVLCEITTGMDISACFPKMYDNQYPNQGNEVFKAYKQGGETAARALIDSRLINEIPNGFTVPDMVELVYYLREENYTLAKYIATEYFKKCPDCEGKMVFDRWLKK